MSSVVRMASVWHMHNEAPCGPTDTYASGAAAPKARHTAVALLSIAALVGPLAGERAIGVGRLDKRPGTGVAISGNNTPANTPAQHASDPQQLHDGYGDPLPRR
jgi:hypothetical protein